MRATLTVEDEGVFFDGSKPGMSSTAARQLLEEVSKLRSVKILVLHDFDKSGFSIAATLRRDTERFQFQHPPEIIDLGLRLEDVREYDLPPASAQTGAEDRLETPPNRRVSALD